MEQVEPRMGQNLAMGNRGLMYVLDSPPSLFRSWPAPSRHLVVTVKDLDAMKMSVFLSERAGLWLALAS